MTLLSPFVLIAIHRFWRRANEGGSDSPLSALRTDRVVLFAVMCYAGLLIVVLFMPVARTALDAVFLQALPTAMKLAP